MKTTFSNDQYDLAYPDGVEYHWWNMARSAVVARVISECVSPSSVVLEVGAGKGVAVKQLRDLGVSCQGVELAAVEPLVGLEGVVATGLRAEDLSEVEREKFDVILLLDVIEHLPKPEEFIRELIASFPNLSTLFVTVPAGPKIWSNYDEFYGHHRRYTLNMLDQLAGALESKSVALSYFFHLPYVPARFMSLLKLKRGIRISPPKGLGMILHRAVAKVMMLDFLFIPRKTPGTSALLCVNFDKK